MNRSALWIGLLASAATIAVDARADEKDACFDAASKGQSLRDAHKLVEARDQFRVCARVQCPAIVQQDCAGWLADIEKGVPTVVITAKDGVGGADLVDVQVTLDGQPLTAKLDGQAVAIDPGSHVLHFELADGTQLDRQVVIKEGAKDQDVAVILSKSGGNVGAAGGTTVESEGATVVEPGGVTIGPSGGATTGSSGGATTGPSGDATTGPSGGVHWKTVGWVLGGIGVVGLGVGAVSGIVAIGDKKSADCNALNQCEAGPLSSARSAANVSDVGLIAGGVLAAAGAALVIFGRNGQGTHAASVRVTPMMAVGGGGLSVGGRW